MFVSIKKCFFTAMTFFSCNVLNVNSLESVPVSNGECKIRTKIINVNTNEPMLYQTLMSPCFITIVLK